MNMTEPDRGRGPLDIILKERPVFIVRWGLVVLLAIALVLFLFSYYAGYAIMPRLGIG